MGLAPDPSSAVSAAQVTSASQSSGGAFGITGPDPVSNLGSYFSAQAANSQAQENTASAENYDTQMADSVYQRGVADMKAAGLNPILAAGSPDPSPTVSAPQTFMPQQNSMSTNISHSAQSAMSNQSDAQTELMQANADESRSRAVNNIANAANTAKEASLIDNDASWADAQKQFSIDHPWLTKIFSGMQRLGLMSNSALTAGNQASHGVSSFASGVAQGVAGE